MLQRFNVVILGVIVPLASCSLQKQEAPSPTGPSEQALSLLATALPDLIAQDGRSEAVVTVTARDPISQPVAGLVMRADILVNGIGADFGTLSSRTLATGRDGRARLVYLAPPAPPPTAENDVVVTILLTPIGDDFASTVPRSVQIRLVRTGLMLPPNGTPRPNFSFSPVSPREHEAVQFDASASSDDGQIVSYSWDFGDGASGTGVRASHAFPRAGIYQVTLTVTNDRRLSASTTAEAVVIAISSNGLQLRGS
jgi:hypothetical protein